MLEMLEKFIEHNRQIKPDFLKGKNLGELLTKSANALEFEIVNFAQEEKDLPLFCVLYKEFEDTKNFAVFSLLPLVRIIDEIIKNREEAGNDKIEIYIKPLFREVYEDLCDAILLLGMKVQRIIIPNEEEFNNEEKLKEIYERAITLARETLKREIEKQKTMYKFKMN